MWWERQQGCELTRRQVEAWPPDHRRRPRAPRSGDANVNALLKVSLQQPLTKRQKKAVWSLSSPACVHLRRHQATLIPCGGTAAATRMWALAQPSMIKLTQQQQLELPLRVPLVALELPLDLLVDPQLLGVFGGLAALLHGRPWLADGGGKDAHGGGGTCGSPALCLHSSSCGIQLRCIPVARRRRADGQSLITGARSRLQLAVNL